MKRLHKFIELFSSRAIPPLLLLFAWEVAARTGAIPARIMPAPSAVIGTFAGMLRTGELPIALLTSLTRVATGLTIGISAGTALALVSGLSRRGETLVDPLMHILRTLPFLGLVPLFIVWFGIGEAPKIGLISLGAAFPTYLNLFAGIRNVDPKLVEALESFGQSRAGLILHVVLPGAAPSFLAGLRHAFAYSLLSLVVAEQINASSGLGALINIARDFLRTDVIVVCLLVYAGLGLISDVLIRRLERHVLAWRPSLVERAA
jgi:sulfonate transport system permease protein